MIDDSRCISYFYLYKNKNVKTKQTYDRKRKWREINYMPLHNLNFL